MSTKDLVFITHDSRVQALFDELEIAWGTQFEIARGVLNDSWTWDDVTEDKLHQLRGSNVESIVHVRRVLKELTKSEAPLNPEI